MKKKVPASIQRLSIGMFAAIASLLVFLQTASNAADEAAKGQQVFQQKCAACHSVGNGTLVGPDLKGVTSRRPREWLEEWIAAPEQVLAKNDQYAVELKHKFHDMQMPNLGLSTSDIGAVIAYLATNASGEPPKAEPATKAQSAAAVQGKPAVGKELFTGVARFEKGGPPCMACHSVSGIGALGGGRLGPDLTDVVTRFGGAAAVDAFVAGTPTPTMNAIWSKNPLGTGERANIVSFLAQAGVTQRPAQAIWQLAGLAMLGLVALLSIAAWRWSHRLRFGVRRPMVAKPTTGHSDARGGGWFEGPYHGGWQARFADERDAGEPRRPTNAPGARS